jgi:hypothetical protein
MKIETAPQQVAARPPLAASQAALEDPAPPPQAPAGVAATLTQGADVSAARTLLRVARDLYAMRPQWLEFFDRMLGVDGHIRKAFPDPEDLAAFECSPEYARIRELIDDLRSEQSASAPLRESRKVLTVRVPRSLHETLKAEAQQLGVSINQLCITKLIRILDEQELGDLRFEEENPL